MLFIRFSSSVNEWMDFMLNYSRIFSNIKTLSSIRSTSASQSITADNFGPDWVPSNGYSFIPRGIDANLFLLQHKTWTYASYIRTEPEMMILMIHTSPSRNHSRTAHISRRREKYENGKFSVVQYQNHSINYSCTHIHTCFQTRVSLPQPVNEYAQAHKRDLLLRQYFFSSTLRSLFISLHVRIEPNENGRKKCAPNTKISKLIVSRNLFGKRRLFGWCGRRSLRHYTSATVLCSLGLAGMSNDGSRIWWWNLWLKRFKITYISVIRSKALFIFSLAFLYFFPTKREINDFVPFLRRRRRPSCVGRNNIFTFSRLRPLIECWEQRKRGIRVAETHSTTVAPQNTNQTHETQ